MITALTANTTITNLTLTITAASGNNTIDNLTNVLELAKAKTTSSIAINGCTALTNASTDLGDCATNYPISFELESDATNDTIGACDDSTITVSVPSTIEWKNTVSGSEPDLSSATWSWVVTPNGGSAETAVTTATLPYAVTSATTKSTYAVVLTATVSSTDYVSETLTFTVGDCLPTFTIT